MLALPCRQSITGISCALAQPRTRRLKRPAIRIRWALSRVSSDPVSARHQTRKPAGNAHAEIRVQDDAIDAIITAAQQVLIQSAQPVAHEGKVRYAATVQTAPKGPLSRSAVSKKRRPLATLGFNSLIQAKIDAAIKAEKDALEGYVKTTQTKTDTILAMEVIYFYLYNKLTSDIQKYLENAKNIKSELQSNKDAPFNDIMPQVNKLLAPIEKLGDFQSLSKEDFQKIAQLGAPPPRDDFMFTIYRLALSHRHIIALRRVLSATEKLMFTSTKYDPRQMAQIFNMRYIQLTYPL